MEKIIGIEKHAGKVRKGMFFYFLISKLVKRGGGRAYGGHLKPLQPPHSEGTENGQMAHKVSTGEQKTGKEKRAAQIVCTYSRNPNKCGM